MKKGLLAMAMSALLAGCATPVFYTNDILNATASSETTKIVPVQEENGEFKIYKVNGDGVAITPKLNAPTSLVGAVSQSLIFSKNQLDSLLKICKQISVEYDGEKVGGAQIIEYHLTLNQSELRGESSAYASQAFSSASASSTTSVVSQ